MKRVVVGLLLLIVCAIGALLWLGEFYVGDRLRHRLEREISSAMGMPSTIRELNVSLWPPRAHIGGVRIGSETALAEVGAADVRVFALASIAEGRPVVAAQIEGLTLDAMQLVKPPPRPPASAPAATRLPPLHLRQFELNGAHLRFPMDHSVGDLTVAHIDARADIALLLRTLTADVAVTGVVLQRKAYRVSLDEIRADGGADAGGLYVRTASVKGQGITANVSATAVPHRHHASATFEPGILGVIVDELSFIGGQASVDGTLSGNLANPVLDGQLTVQRGAIGRHVLGDLKAHVTRAGTKLGFDALELSGTPGQVTGAVEIVIAKENPIRGDLSWHGVDLEGMLAIIGTAVPLRNRMEGTTTVRGQLDPLDLDVSGGGTLGGMDETTSAVANWRVTGRIHPHTVDAQLDVTQPQDNRVAVKFLLDDPKLGGTITLAAADLGALRALLPHPVDTLPITGQGQGTAELSGTTDHPTIGGGVDLKDLTVAGSAVTHVGGDFAIARQMLTTKSLRLDAQMGNAELHGTLALDNAAHNDWQLHTADLDTNVVLGVVQAFSGLQTSLSNGAVDAAIECRGPWPHADGKTELTARRLYVGREPIDRLDISATAALPGWTLHLNANHAGSENLSVDAKGNGTASVDATVDSTPFDLAHFRDPRRYRLAGMVAIHGQLSGELRHPDGTLQVNGTGIAIRNHAIGDVTVTGSGRHGEWTLKGAALAQTLDIAATLGTAAPVPYSVRAKWTDSQLGTVIAADQSLQLVTSGDLNLAGSMEALAVPSGAIHVTRFDVSRDQGKVQVPEPVRIDVDRGQFSIRSLALESAGSRLSVSGGWTLRGDVNLEARGQGELVLLELIGPPFQSARGQFSITADVRRGGAAAWDLRGQATVRDVALDLGLPVSFTDTNGAFSLSGGTVHIDSFAGKTGGGEFQIGGGVDLNRGPALTWNVKEVGMTVPEWLEERVSGDGRFEGTWRVMTMGGNIEVLNALYDRNIEIKDLLPWFKEQVAPAPRTAAPAREIRLDLHAHAPGGLFVDNNFAKVEMRADDFWISGTPDALALLGTIEFIGGEVTFRQHRFQVTGGSIDFRDRLHINPILNITADSLISTSDAEYTVTASVTGTAENPRVQFSADDPGLSQNDVISLVTFGKTSAQLQREGGGVGVGDVLAVVPTGGVQERVRTFFGVDRFEIEPAFVPETGAIEPRVTIGKDVTERLRALASSSFGVEARRSMQIEYRITRRISLLGSWESRTQAQAGAFGGDIKFRYEFRKIPFSLFSGATSSSPQSNAR